MRSAWFVVVAVALMLSLPSFVQANDDEVKPVSDSARLQQLVNELNAQRVRLDAQAAEIEILRSNASVQPSLSLDGTSIPAEMDPTGPAQAKPALPEDVKSKWGMNIYGFVEADFISDNRQLGGLVDAAGNPALPRGESYASQHGQLTFGARNSRIGLNANAPEFAGIRASGKLEMDFLGINGGTTATAANLGTNPEANATWNNPSFRIRHMYLTLDTDYITFTFGQGWELFGWQPYFHPNTVDIQGVPGQIYSRTPKMQFSHKIKGPVDIEAAVALSRPPQRDANTPDFQGGIKITIPEWVGVHTMGATGTAIDAAGIGISGTDRGFRVPNGAAVGGQFPSDATRGSAAALDLFLPILHPDKESRGNSLSVTGEFVYGKGISDLYSGFNMGAGAVNGGAAGNPVDGGSIAYRGTDLVAIPVTTDMLGVQYYLPGDGTWWLSLNYGATRSRDIALLGATPGALFNPATIFNRSQFLNVDLFWDVTPAVRLGLSIDQYKDHYMNYTAVSAAQYAMDTRVQFSAFFLF